MSHLLNPFSNHDIINDAKDAIFTKFSKDTTQQVFLLMQKKELIKLIKILSIVSLSIFSLYIYAASLKKNNLEAFQKKVEESSNLLDTYFNNNQILGSARTLGLTDPNFKEIVKGRMPLDDPRVLETLKYIKEQYTAAIVYVLNKEGTAVACTPYDGQKSLTGNNYAFRPYFQHALEGKDIVYPALGITTKERGLYYASPIYDELEKKVLGVFVVKLGLEKVDAFVDSFNFPVAISSPEHILFATNKKEWLLKSLVPIENEELKEIEATRQFSGAALIQPIGQLTQRGKFKSGKVFYSIIFSPLSLEDSQRTWDLLFFIRSEKIFSVFSYAIGFAVIAFFCFLLIYLVNVQDEKNQFSEDLESKNQRLVESEKRLKQANKELLQNDENLKKVNASLDLRVKQRTKELEKEKASLEIKVQERTKDLEAERKSLEEKVKIRTKQLEEAKASLELKVQQRTEELAKNVERLEEANKSMIGREKRILELKDKLKKYEKTE